METKSFVAPLPIAQTAAETPLLQITATISGDQITITEQLITGRTTKLQTYSIQAAAGNAFQIPDNTPPDTANMLIGIGQRLRSSRSENMPPNVQPLQQTV